MSAVDCRGAVCAIRDVEAKDARRQAAGIHDGSTNLFGGREVVAAMQNDLKAAGRQPFSDGAADAAARAGHENAAIGRWTLSVIVLTPDHGEHILRTVGLDVAAREHAVSFVDGAPNATRSFSSRSSRSARMCNVAPSGNHSTSTL